MSYSYTTKGTCSRKITFDLEDGIVKNVRFIGGCDGNTKGIAKLVDGMKADDVIKKLEGTQCGFRGTSCPDQLTLALRAALAKS